MDTVGAPGDADVAGGATGEPPAAGDGLVLFAAAVGGAAAGLGPVFGAAVPTGAVVADGAALGAQAAPTIVASSSPLASENRRMGFFIDREFS